MATQLKELSYGTVEIYNEESDILGIGSYGKVCKAKCGQLPCAAKLLHDTMFGTSDPGIHNFVERFRQECQFLSAIKHPNIVQFLGTLMDPRTQRLALLMELMDDSLTKFLERSTGPLPYHTQLNICQDVALALAYLHSNDIIHRDLSSNNVLLIGKGILAKVTDFGMSKIKGMNSLMTPLTMCPGTLVYMPPEALITPPRYSSKLDCFSHGVLTIQIATREFPNPGDAKSSVSDKRSPTGKIEIPVAETNRRKKDIGLVAPDHPLLPLALHSLKDRDTERPSADELCKQLATLKLEPSYIHSVEQSREQNMSVQTLQEQLKKARGSYETELQEFKANLRQQIRDEEATVREEYQQQLNLKDTLVAKYKTELQTSRAEYEAEIEHLHKKYHTLQQKFQANNRLLAQATNKRSFKVRPMKFTWIQEAPSPAAMSSYWGAAVVHGKTTYFSDGCNIHSYKLPDDKWSTLTPCKSKGFSLEIVNDKLTVIGGWKDSAASNALITSSTQNKWEQVLPPMPTARVKPAAVTTSGHLVVVGGRTKLDIVSNWVSTTEILDLNLLQWSTASSSPKALGYSPHMTLCHGHLYLSEINMMFCSSVEELLKSCKPPSTDSSDGGSVWTRLTDMPVPYGASLATLRGHVLAIGGRNAGCSPVGTIHCYDQGSNLWSIIGEMPTPRYDTLIAVLSNKELIVTGGYGRGCWCLNTEVGSEGTH